MPYPIKLDLDRFIIIHVLLPLILFLILFFGSEISGLDFWISKHFYNLDTKQWPYKQNWIAETLLHHGGRVFIYVLAVAVLISLLLTFRPSSEYTNYRKPLCYLLLASVIGPSIIAYLKNHTHMYCPWDLIAFGGNRPYVRLLDTLNKQLPVGHCFPAAHAGAGYSFVSLYFFFIIVKRELKLYGLGFGLLLGLSFGVAQQIRGAHFFSHDVFALTVDWFSSLVTFILFFRKQIAWS